MTKLLRGVSSDLPNLWFRTQESDGNARPDMWGFDEKGLPHVFVENKFWAGLTDKQPVAYLQSLAQSGRSSVLLFVVPEQREQTLWRELRERTSAAGILIEPGQPGPGVAFSAATSIGPTLSLTSWGKLLAFLELETAHEPSARSDLLQLRALCSQANNEAFAPFAPDELSDQRIPFLILQLNSVVLDMTTRAFNEGYLHRGRLLPQADSSRMGRYVSLYSDESVGLWLGLHLGLWKKHGLTPLWLHFSTTQWGRASEVKALLEPWAATRGIFVTSEPDGAFVVALRIATGLEKEKVVGFLLAQVQEIHQALKRLSRDPAKPELSSSLDAPNAVILDDIGCSRSNNNP